MANERKDKKMRVDERVDDCDLETPQEMSGSMSASMQ